MPFLLFEQKNKPSIELPPLAMSELVVRLDRDFPSYVQQLPCIYDVLDRKSHNGAEACTQFLSKFQPAPIEPEVVVAVVEPAIEEEKVEEPEPVKVAEPKKKVTRTRKPKAESHIQLN
jgi:hypothetical protein